MYFCPFCGTLLQLGKPDLFQYFCGTCSYTVGVSQILTRTYSFLDQNKVRPDDEDVFRVGDASAAAAEGSQLTSIRCASNDGGVEACTGEKAFYIQVQMRSADEPPTTFFKCVSCGFQWRSD